LLQAPVVSVAQFEGEEKEWAQYGEMLGDTFVKPLSYRTTMHTDGN